MTAPTYTKSGSKATTPVKLSAKVFDVMPTNFELIKLAYDAYVANGRENLAVTKTRGLVRGGGRKPWAQKGTGRARFGSIRNPIWRGGGIAFGPTGVENYSKKVPLTLKRQAIRQALSLAVSEGRIYAIETIEAKEGKVKPIVTLLQKMDLNGSVLLVTSLKNDLLERATRNLPAVQVVQAMYINVFDLVNADAIVISRKSLDIVNDWLGTTKRIVPAEGKK